MEKSKFDRNRQRVKQCPCGKSNRDGKFVPIVGEELYGYCHSCGESFFPQSEKSDFNHMPVKQLYRVERPKPLPSFIDYKYVRASQRQFSENSFFVFIKKMFGERIAIDLFSKYKVGTAAYYLGATVFWQIDIHGRPRTGKIMGYDPDDGKRIKEPKEQLTWVHSVLRLPDFNLQQCLFGEHLLKEKSPDIPVAIVESEKTAIIASHFFPDYLWLATGGKSNLKDTLFDPLRGRNVMLFPDGGEFTFWKDKADKIQKQFIDINFYISNILERKVSQTDISEGYDIADYLIAESQNKRSKQTRIGEIIENNDILKKLVSVFDLDMDKAIITEKIEEFCKLNPIINRGY